MDDSDSWKKVWERQEREACNLTLQNLIRLDGFVRGLGKMSEEVWLKLCQIVIEKLDIKEGDRLLEVGCGAGALLLPLSSLNIRISGIDYSDPLISVAKKVMPDGEFLVSEARCLPFKERGFSKILSHSVFYYFPSFGYASEALCEILRVLRPKGRVLIMDIPDLSKKDKSQQARQQALISEGAEPGSWEGERYPPHLYYPKTFFRNFAEMHNLGVEIFGHELAGYGNSPFRFNVLLWR